MNQSPYHGIPSSPKRRKLFYYDSEVRRLPSSLSARMTDIDCVEDIFLNIMTYFVGTDGIDLTSIENSQYVCKRWNDFLSLSTFWKHVEATSKYSDETVKSRLAGFINLGSITPTKPNDVETLYKVKQRSTGTIFKLKILHGSSCYPWYCLREIAALKQVKRRQGCVEHMSLLNDWCRCGGDILHWYEYSGCSLFSYIEMQTDYTSVFRNLMFQSLEALKEVHDCGIHNVILSTESIVLFPRETKEPLVKLCDFEFSSVQSTTLTADKCEQFNHNDVPESIRAITPNIMCLRDCFRLGIVFEELLEYAITFRDKISTKQLRSGNKFYKKVLEILGQDGMSIFCHLLQPKLPLRISTTDALQDVYFKDMKSKNDHLKMNFEDSLNSPRAYPSLLYNHPKIQLEEEERADIVDWLFEVVTVLNKKTRTVYLAMEYFDWYLRNSANSNIDVDKLQLIAITFLYIASKINDDVCLKVSDLPFCADKRFGVECILSMEDTILRQIRWELPIPTTYDSVTFYLDRMKMDADSKIFWLSLYISEFALQAELYHHSLCVIAATIIMIALYSTGAWTGWSHYKEHFFQIDLESMISCYQDLQLWLVSKENYPYLDVIDKRYSIDSRMHVASTNLILLPASTMREKLM